MESLTVLTGSLQRIAGLPIIAPPAQLFKKIIKYLDGAARSGVKALPAFDFALADNAFTTLTIILYFLKISTIQIFILFHSPDFLEY